MNSPTLGQAFLNHEAIEGVLFEHNECVKVISGANVGKIGWLVTVLSTEPEPNYILELESGYDIQALQSELEKVAN